MIIIAIIVLLFFLAAPLKTKIVLAIINIFLPDPIPYVDEFIMWGNIFLNITKAKRIIEFVWDHKALSIFCGITGVIILFNI
ncbi:hypothetical protein [Clostridium lacusfryxellense]|uniref:hypothetical protein n=1 Tax=Clostridium lacusfryxellense TaxID=205328 RepID=UPI001C0C2677|nr:hypothetical protein [Clostridium lacusfryxellense]MBU3112701.1 hypothetical protein [Clostridium lacusfryxellense]